MAEPTSSGAVGMAVGVLTINAAMMYAPFGVSLVILVLGGMCYFAGAACRTGTVIGKALEAGQDPHIGRYMIALAFSIPTAAVASSLVFFSLKVIGIEADAAAGGVLLLAGLKGNDGIQSIVSMVGSVFGKFGGGGPKP